MGQNNGEEATPLLVNNGPVQASYPTPQGSNDYHGYPSTPSMYPPPPAPHAYPSQAPPAGYSPYPPPGEHAPYNSYPNNFQTPPYPPAGYNPSYVTNAPIGSAPPPTALPPSYAAPVTNAEGFCEVPCRVCHQTVKYSANKKMSAVKCTSCNHATQVGPPPAGKNFILCQCNTLLTVPMSAKAATCPKADCKRTLILAPEDPGKSRAFCAHCNTLLTYKAVSAVVMCPKCKGRSVVNRSRLHWYVGFNVMIGFLFIALGLFLTLGSYEASDGGFYFVFWGFCVCGVLALIRAIVYSSMNWRARDAVYVPV